MDIEIIIVISISIVIVTIIVVVIIVIVTVIVIIIITLDVAPGKGGRGNLLSEVGLSSGPSASLLQAARLPPASALMPTLWPSPASHTSQVTTKRVSRLLQLCLGCSLGNKPPVSSLKAALPPACVLMLFLEWNLHFVAHQVHSRLQARISDEVYVALCSGREAVLSKHSQT